MSDLPSHKRFRRAVSGEMGKDNRIVVPKPIREFLEIEDGDSLAFFYNDHDEFAVVQKAPEEEETYEGEQVYKKKPLHKRLIPVVIALLVASALFSPIGSFAQEDVAPTNNNTTATTETVPPPQSAAPIVPPSTEPPALQDTERFFGPVAYVPFILEMTYPAGVDVLNVPAVHPLSSASVYEWFEFVNINPGLISRTFKTTSLDTFTITVAQSYNQPMDGQVANFVIRAGETNQVVWQKVHAIHGSGFNVVLEFTTSQAPKIPTADELNQGVYSRIQEVKDQMNGIAGEVRTSTQTFNNSVPIMQNVTGAIGLFLLFAIPITVANWRMMRSQRPKKEGSGMLDSQSEQQSSNKHRGSWW